MNRKVMIATPSRIIGRGLAGIVDRIPDMSVVGTVDGMQSCIERVGVLAPDVLIVDSSFFVPLSRVQIYSAYPELQDKTVVCLVSNVSADWLVRQFDGSISIYDDEERVERKLREAIENCDAEPHRENNEISDREREVLVLIAGGMINKEIADRLNISVHTVIAHRKNISRKTGIKSVAGLTVYAMMNNLLDYR